MNINDRSRALLLSLLDQAARLARELDIEIDPDPSELGRRDAQIRRYFVPAVTTREFKARGDFDCPATVRGALVAYETILRVLKRHKVTYTGGCRAFQTPAEWIGGDHWVPGPLTLLVVVYDGGDLPDFFRLGVDSRRYEAMRKALADAGLCAEELTITSTAIYTVERPEASLTTT